MRTRATTILDVAQQAGVSRQTVTRAMNGMYGISPATRDLVLRVADELGYRPSRFASNLARQKHFSLGVVIGSLRNPFYMDFADEVLNVAELRDWQVTIARSGRDSSSSAIQRLAPHVDAVVGYLGGDEGQLLQAARGLPLVDVEPASPRVSMHSVTLDFDRGMAELVDQLRARGSRNFAMIDSGPRGGGDERMASWRATARRQSLERRVTLTDVEPAHESLAEAAEGLRTLLARSPQIDTVIAFNDLIAMGAMQEAHRLGLQIPRDIKIVGIDGLSLGEVMDPPLTSLSLEAPLIARTVVEILDDVRADAAPTAPKFHTRSVTPVPLWRASA
ncbi:MAG TPA: LacI family DNA-binding transcriptional regulator [Candidatus Lumbricidophila sp.]|nr:LacI family DNA-binding transcriptional regulator [Candidatus Lumbricidophila sp.]